MGGESQADHEGTEMTSAPAIPAPIKIRREGDLSPAAVRALAALLIAHARREIQGEGAKAGDDDQQQRRNEE